MGLFDFAKICLFSEVNGVVTLNGTPVAGVEVVRTSELGCNDKIFTDKTFTNDQGHYYFPARFTHSICKIAPVEPHIDQKIVFFHQGKAYLGWHADKRSYEINSELGRPIHLACGLDHDPQMKAGEYHIDGFRNEARRAIHGVCIAKGMVIEESTLRKPEE